VRKTWDSITDASLGAEWLFQTARASGFTGDAQADFDDGAGGEDENPNDQIGETPLERMLNRYRVVLRS
jgi:hypothetical protein